MALPYQPSASQLVAMSPDVLRLRSRRSTSNMPIDSLSSICIMAFICGVGGLTLTGEERAFLQASQPWGFILFKRNVSDHAQVAALVSDLRNCVGRADAPVLIDQEGGRVQRLQPQLAWRPSIHSHAMRRCRRQSGQPAR